MPVHQYVYFALFSRHTTADEMTSQLGLAPDEVSVRGSRFTEPGVVPVDHCWKVVCRETDLCVDEQITAVLDRLRPHQERIAALAGQLAPTGGGAVLQVVRYFNAGDQNGSHKPEETPDAPNLFGWHLDRDILDFLAAVGAPIDVDEYDMSDTRGADEDAGPGRPTRSGDQLHYRMAELRHDLTTESSRSSLHTGSPVRQFARS